MKCVEDSWRFGIYWMRQASPWLWLFDYFLYSDVLYSAEILLTIFSFTPSNSQCSYSFYNIVSEVKFLESSRNFAASIKTSIPPEIKDFWWFQWEQKLINLLKLA